MVPAEVFSLDTFLSEVEDGGMSDKVVCPSVVEFEPEPSAGSIEVRCFLLKGHDGEHTGELYGHFVERPGGRSVGVQGEVRWS